MQSARTAIVIGGLIPALFLLFILGVLLVGGEEDKCAPSDSRPGLSVDPSTVPQGPIAGYGHEQLVNAAHIMQAGKALGLSQRDQTIGVMTAMGESSLRVIDYGDAAGPDSRGLFQQRDNGAWGSYSDRMDPFISATNFFRELMKITDRDSLEPTQVAHLVQRNADPFHYTKFWDSAVKVVEGLGGIQSAAPPPALDVPSTYSLGPVKPHTAAVANRLGPMFGFKTIGGYRDPGSEKYDQNGHPAGLALDFMTNDIDNGEQKGDQLASYLVSHAEEVGVKYIIWKQQIWNIDRAAEGWRMMEDRGSITQNHYDHVHLSLKAEGTTSLPAGCTPGTPGTPGAVGSGGWAAPAAGPITSPFGMRWHPVLGVWRQHNGVDLGGGGCNGPIWAAQGGKVKKRYFDGGGNGTLILDHGGGVETYYLHMERGGFLVSEGDRVETGQQIAKVGNSGYSTGCHLHFEIRLNGTAVDPVPYLKNLGVNLG